MPREVAGTRPSQSAADTHYDVNSIRSRCIVRTRRAIPQWELQSPRIAP
jgi:hypothetical protein